MSEKRGPGLFARMADLYARMERAYHATAKEAGLTCVGCETNCCVSYFQHHTHMEWAYLRRGLASLNPKQRKIFVKRAGEYAAHAREQLTMGLVPVLMCPLNEKGLCALYEHRMMICRMHGTRNSLTLPSGEVRIFSGCARFTALPAAKETDHACPTLDRTPFYRELADLEMAYQGKAIRPLARVNLTLADMILTEPPRLR